MHNRDIPLGPSRAYPTVTAGPSEPASCRGEPASAGMKVGGKDSALKGWKHFESSESCFGSAGLRALRLERSCQLTPSTDATCHRDRRRTPPTLPPPQIP